MTFSNHDVAGQICDEQIAFRVCVPSAVLTRPWTLHILWSLSENGPIRFGALRKSVTRISARVLTERLRTLEAEDSCFVTTSQRFLWL